MSSTQPNGPRAGYAPTPESEPYDVRRAYEKLRGEFEPGRMLIAGTADMRDEVGTILFVLDEAFEILSDDRRRERYRRALEAAPR